MHEKPHELFERDGDDLHCSIDVPMVDAALGTSVSIDVILDGPTELAVPAGTQPETVVTLRGRGMPHLRSGARGDLHAHVNVVVPTRLDARDTELLNELRANRQHERSEVTATRAAAAHNGGGIFSRLRETFTGR